MAIVVATLPFQQQLLFSTGGPIRAKKEIVVCDLPQTLSLKSADIIEDIVMIYPTGS